MQINKFLSLGRGLRNQNARGGADKNKRNKDPRKGKVVVPCAMRSLVLNE
jgi:hypothetical protein